MFQFFFEATGQFKEAVQKKFLNKLFAFRKSSKILDIVIDPGMIKSELEARYTMKDGLWCGYILTCD